MLCVRYIAVTIVRPDPTFLPLTIVPAVLDTAILVTFRYCVWPRRLWRQHSKDAAPHHRVAFLHIGACPDFQTPGIQSLAGPIFAGHPGGLLAPSEVVIRCCTGGNARRRMDSVRARAKRKQKVLKQAATEKPA